MYDNSNQPFHFFELRELAFEPTSKNVQQPAFLPESRFMRRDRASRDWLSAGKRTHLCESRLTATASQRAEERHAMQVSEVRRKPRTRRCRYRTGPDRRADHHEFASVEATLRVVPVREKYTTRTLALDMTFLRSTVSAGLRAGLIARITSIKS
jgi:hypothetical protein